MNIKLKALPKSITNQTILLRADLNVPFQNGKITDTTRIDATIPTIKDLIRRGNHVIIISHLGRPKGQPDPQLSLHPIAHYLQATTKIPTSFIPFAEMENFFHSHHLQASITLLDNIRFFPGEEKNSTALARQLSQLADLYVNDAFAAAHRKHASTFAITKFLPSYAGPLMIKEVNQIQKFLNYKQHPYTFVIGGAKIDTKVKLIKNILPLCDFVLLGGAVANTFLAAQQINIGQSLHQPEYVKTAQQILSAATKHNTSIVLPIDGRTATKITSQPSDVTIKPINQISSKDQILDIGPETIRLFQEILGNSKVIIWNGPLGLYEKKPFLPGTKHIAQTIASSNAKTLIGGGDSLDAINHLKLPHAKFTHVSTGGGAMLELMENQPLPCLIPLTTN